MKGIELSRWVNLTSHPITFIKGVSGVPWPGCDSRPGEVIEAPASYERVCHEAGYTLVTPEIQEMLDEDARKILLASPIAENSVTPTPVLEVIAPLAPSPISPEPVKTRRRRG
jgi:hypothetical protein